MPTSETEQTTMGTTEYITRKEYERRHRHLWVGWIISFLLLFVGTLSLAIGLRNEGIGRRDAQVEQDRAVQKTICQKQNELRTNIRNFVIQLSNNPATEEEVRKAFPSVDCEEVVSDR